MKRPLDVLVKEKLFDNNPYEHIAEFIQDNQQVTRDIVDEIVSYGYKEYDVWLEISKQELDIVSDDELEKLVKYNFFDFDRNKPTVYDGREFREKVLEISKLGYKIVDIHAEIVKQIKDGLKDGSV